jgi:Ca-activated chloride channel family protein
MLGKPTPIFWVSVITIAIGLFGLSLYRSGIFNGDGPGAKYDPKIQKSNITGDSDLNNIGTRRQVVVQIASSVTKQKWMEEAVRNFYAAGRNKTPKGAKIVVEVRGVRSGGSMWKILDGRLKPVVWSPGAVSWVEQFRKRWKEKTNHSLISQKCPASVFSPIGIAMWRPMAEALGWPDKPVGFKKIVELASDPKGWARYGHPEWGKLRIGHPHPLYSSAGMLFLSAFSYGIKGKTADLTAADIYESDVKNAFKTLAQNTSKYGMISTDLLRLMAEQGPSFLHAVSAFEEGTVRLNIEWASELRFPVAFIFPEEGTFWSSHPYCILDKAEWVDEDEAEAAKIFLDFLLTRSQQEAAARNLLRPLDSSITIQAPLDLEHGTDPRITMETVPPLAIPSADVSAAIIDMFMQTKRKATVLVLLDISGSMKGEKIRSATRATSAFLKRFDPNDIVGVSTFSSSVSKLSPLSPIKNMRETLPDKVENLIADGGTSLYDAVRDGMRLMEQVRQKNEKAGIKRLYGMVVLSDGEDTESKITENELFTTYLPAQAESEGIKIFPIAFGNSAKKLILKRMADRTGGRMHSADPRSIEKIYLRISAEQ